MDRRGSQGDITTSHAKPFLLVFCLPVMVACGCSDNAGSRGNAGDIGLEVASETDMSSDVADVGNNDVDVGRASDSETAGVGDVAPMSCSAYPPSDCEEADECMPYVGLVEDVASECIHEEVAFCIPLPSGCAQASLPVEDPLGRCWRFRNGCEWPDGWDASDKAATECGRRLESLPFCE